jgi:hypothetical protein
MSRARDAMLLGGLIPQKLHLAARRRKMAAHLPSGDKNPVNPQKLRAKAAAELASLLKDEKAHLAKYARTRNLLRILGIAGLLIAWSIAGTPWDWTAATAAMFALVGGFLGGVSVAFDNSLQSWPIVRPLLKENALELLKDGGAQ